MISKIKEKDLARSLRKKGCSIRQITTKLGVAKSSVSNWVRDIELTDLQKFKLHKRELIGGQKGRILIAKRWQDYRFNNPKQKKNPRWPKRDVETYFDTWTPDMAYILGYFAADGTMYINKNGSCYIGFTSTDKELIEIVKSILGISNKVEVYKSLHPHYKDRYNIQLGSKKIYQRFLELGFTPRKSLTLNFPDIPQKLLNHFVRGYFDGDGCIYYKMYHRKNRNNRLYHMLRLSFTSGSRNFLEDMQIRITSVLNITKTKLIKKQGGYDLAYFGRNVVELYSFLYPTDNLPYLSRKHQIFKRGITQLKIWGRSAVVARFPVTE